MPITLIDSDNKILFAHAERYSGIKNDSNLNKEMFEDMEQYRSESTRWYRLFGLKIHM